jgi:DNA segregation ATPase FtsK/SpoIIIE-like protein
MPDVDFNELVVHMRRNGISVDDGQIPDYDEKYHEAKEIILSEGAALPEILCDVLLIGKNRAERIFEQFERDGIVTPKDENGKRKIIK